MLERNILASQLIDKLEIRCANRLCNWTGELQDIVKHLPNCEYRESNMPAWFRQLAESYEAEREAEELKAALVMEQEELDVQRQE